MTKNFFFFFFFDRGVFYNFTLRWFKSLLASAYSESSVADTLLEPRNKLILTMKLFSFSLLILLHFTPLQTLHAEAQLKLNGIMANCWLQTYSRSDIKNRFSCFKERVPGWRPLTVNIHRQIQKPDDRWSIGRSIMLVKSAKRATRVQT